MASPEHGPPAAAMISTTTETTPAEQGHAHTAAEAVTAPLIPALEAFLLVQAALILWILLTRRLGRRERTITALETAHLVTEDLEQDARNARARLEHMLRALERDPDAEAQAGCPVCAVSGEGMEAVRPALAFDPELTRQAARLSVFLRLMTPPPSHRRAHDGGGGYMEREGGVAVRTGTLRETARRTHARLGEYLENVEAFRRNLLTRLGEARSVLFLLSPRAARGALKPLPRPLLPGDFDPPSAGAR